MSKEGSILQQTSATANALTVTRCTNGINNVGGPLVDCEGGIFDLTIEGSGHTSTGTLIEIDSVVSYRLENVRLYNGGGRGLQLNGGTERLESRDLTIMLTRWPLVIGSTSNESYFSNTKVLYPGQTADNYCFNINCVNGVYPTSGPIAPDPHGAIYNYEGVNVGFYGGSIQVAADDGGLQDLQFGADERRPLLLRVRLCESWSHRGRSRGMDDDDRRDDHEQSFVSSAERFVDAAIFLIAQRRSDEHVGGDLVCDHSSGFPVRGARRHRRWERGLHGERTRSCRWPDSRETGMGTWAAGAGRRMAQRPVAWPAGAIVETYGGGIRAREDH